MRIIVTILLSLWTAIALGASFDCKKAETLSEKLICSDLELSQADSELGAAYKAAIKAFPVKDFIKFNQKSWLENDYKSCDEKTACLSAAKKRTETLKNFLNVDVYSNGPEFNMELGVFIIYKNTPTPTVHIFGFYFPGGSTYGHKEHRGYPYDGDWCDETFPLTTSGTSFTLLEIGVYESPFKIVVDDKKAEVTSQLMCGTRAFIRDGIYERIRKK